MPFVVQVDWIRRYREVVLVPRIIIGKSFRFSVNRSTIKLQLRLFSWLHYYGLLVILPSINTMGVLSRCAGDGFNRHCIFLDYDDCMLSVVENDIRFVQRQYDAGTAVILQSGETDFNVAGAEYGNWHVIFPTKASFSEVHEIVGQTHTDFNFREVPAKFNYRAYVLRIYPKVSENGAIIRDRPVFRRLMLGPTTREVYRPLYDFLRKWYAMPGWPAKFAPNLDNLTELSLIRYNTTMGWHGAISDKIKSLRTNIRMHLMGGGLESRIS